MSKRAIETASSALNIPVHADSRADLAVDQLVDNLVLQLQVILRFYHAESNFSWIVFFGQYEIYL